MPEANGEGAEFKGLCSTCNHKLQCVYAKRATKPVWFCEEFDSYVGPEEKEEVEAIPPAVEEVVEEDYFPAQLIGLCKDCDLNDTCSIPKPEGGVWNCDDYREFKRMDLEREFSLLEILEEIQGQYGYLPENVLNKVSTDTGYSMVVIYGVATFYKSFNLKPRGRHIISICLGTACHVRGGPAVAEAFEKELGISAGETTEDKEFTLETVACLGACALGPIVVADGHYYSKVGPKMAKNIIQETAKGLDMLEVGPDQETFPVELSCPRCNHTFMDPHHKLENLPSIKVTVSFGGKYGWLRLSALYGSYTVESKHEIPKGAVVNLFCPNCHGELLGSTKCAECGAGMVPMIVRGGGIVQICLRRGCKGHMLDLGSS